MKEIKISECPCYNCILNPICSEACEINFDFWKGITLSIIHNNCKECARCKYKTINFDNMDLEKEFTYRRKYPG